MCIRDRPWNELFKPAVALASDGFPISGRMAAAIDGSRDLLQTDPEAAA